MKRLPRDANIRYDSSRNPLANATESKPTLCSPALFLTVLPVRRPLYIPYLHIYNFGNQKLTLYNPILSKRNFHHNLQESVSSINFVCLDDHIIFEVERVIYFKARYYFMVYNR